MYAYCTIEPSDSGKVELITADLGKQEEYEAEDKLRISRAYPILGTLNNLDLLTK